MKAIKASRNGNLLWGPWRRLVKDFFTYSGLRTMNSESLRLFMLTSSNGNIFRVTGLVRIIHRSPVDPLTKADGAELWCYHWSAPEQMVEQTFEPPVIETPSRSLWRHCNVSKAKHTGDVFSVVCWIQKWRLFYFCRCCARHYIY